MAWIKTIIPYWQVRNQIITKEKQSFYNDKCLEKILMTKLEKERARKIKLLLKQKKIPIVIDSFDEDIVGQEPNINLQNCIGTFNYNNIREQQSLAVKKTKLKKTIHKTSPKKNMSNLITKFEMPSNKDLTEYINSLSIPSKKNKRKLLLNKILINSDDIEDNAEAYIEDELNFLSLPKKLKINHGFAYNPPQDITQIEDELSSLTIPNKNKSKTITKSHFLQPKKIKPTPTDTPPP